jgi:hypothetical protein
MKPVKEMNIGELAAYVSSHIARHGITVTLTGGACVSIHTDGAFISYDLDFIEQITAGRRKLKRLLSEIGFSEHNRYFRHPETEFFLEFPAGPLAVGKEPPSSVIQLTFETGTFNILSPTDCIKDRLAGYFYWDDRQCLEQALDVAKNNQVDIKEIKRWAINEDQEKKLKNFLQQLSA